MEDALAAAARLQMPENARRLSAEYNMLRALGTGDRSPAQETRFRDLSVFHKAVWEPALRQLGDGPANGQTPERAKAYRADVDRQSRSYERRK